jgi:hypothetical protein
MGTKADFYIGRGESAEWIGSIGCDGYPDGIDAKVLGCQSEEEFRHAIADFLKGRDDETLPEDGWPWCWPDSRMTDFAYAFDAGSVRASCFGRSWFDPADRSWFASDQGHSINKRRTALFPDMFTATQWEEWIDFWSSSADRAKLALQMLM